MKYLLSWFQKPYPLPESPGSQLKVASLLSAVVFLFLFLFRPFNQHETMPQALSTALVGGLTVLVVILFHFFVLFRLFPRFFREEQWTIGRELAWTLVIIITIALANMAVMALWGSFPFSWRAAGSVTLATAIVGMAPATVSIVINQARLLRRYRKAALALNEVVQQETAVAATAAIAVEEAAAGVPTSVLTPAAAEQGLAGLVTLTAEIGKESVTVEPAALLAISSADNYCRVYIRNGGRVRTVVLRSPLKRLEGLLAGRREFWRCHRTAIVNLGAITAISGTAQGYRLELAPMEDTIPVSRSLNSQLPEKLGVHQ